jgi:hypothetical protein
MGKLTDDLINEALEALGWTLSMRGEQVEIVVIGGGNLIYSGLVTRPTTKDLDILGRMSNGEVLKFRPLPQAFTAAVADVAAQLDLPADWINLGPESLLDKGLPAGFCERIEREVYGSLTVWFAGRLDLIAFKVYAAANPNRRDAEPGRHHRDLVDLKPTNGELDFAIEWMSAWADDDLVAAAEVVTQEFRS